MRVTVELTGKDLTLETLYFVVFDSAEAALSSRAREKVDASRAVIERAVRSEAAVYGVNTGFGDGLDANFAR
jgi:histidine ammonia-lyase